MDELTTTTLLQGGSALLIATLGVWVATIKPRSKATMGFVVFAVGFGSTLLIGNATTYAHMEDSPWEDAPRSIMSLAYFGGLVLMALHFPHALRRDERQAFAWSALVTAGLAVAMAAVRFGGISGAAPIRLAFLVSDSLAFAALSGYTLLLALRSAKTPDTAERKRLALTAAALLLYVAFAAGAGFGPASGPLRAGWPGNVFAWAYFAAMLAAAGVWLAAMRGPGARAARNLALLTLGLLLAGLVATAVDLQIGERGIARVLMVLTLAYAILKHQLLGLDVKLRFAISKSTLAAAFIAVFFVAGEAAQQFFGEQFESGYLGILAAGALVFAIAPLSRLADRIAEKAVPIATPAAQDSRPPSTADDDRQESIYRNALRLALRDRRLTRTEEAHLHELAEALRIRPRRAHEMLAEAEREREAGP